MGVVAGVRVGRSILELPFRARSSHDRTFLVRVGCSGRAVCELNDLRYSKRIQGRQPGTPGIVCPEKLDIVLRVAKNKRRPLPRQLL